MSEEVALPGLVLLRGTMRLVLKVSKKSWSLKPRDTIRSSATAEVRLPETGSEQEETSPSPPSSPAASLSSTPYWQSLKGNQLAQKKCRNVVCRVPKAYSSV